MWVLSVRFSASDRPKVPTLRPPSYIGDADGGIAADDSHAVDIISPVRSDSRVGVSDMSELSMVSPTPPSRKPRSRRPATAGARRSVNEYEQSSFSPSALAGIAHPGRVTRSGSGRSQAVIMGLPGVDDDPFGEVTSVHSPAPPSAKSSRPASASSSRRAIKPLRPPRSGGIKPLPPPKADNPAKPLQPLAPPSVHGAKFVKQHAADSGQGPVMELDDPFGDSAVVAEPAPQRQRPISLQGAKLVKAHHSSGSAVASILELDDPFGDGSLVPARQGPASGLPGQVQRTAAKPAQHLLLGQHGDPSLGLPTLDDDFGQQPAGSARPTSASRARLLATSPGRGSSRPSSAVSTRSTASVAGKVRAKGKTKRVPKKPKGKKSGGLLSKRGASSSRPSSAASQRSSISMLDRPGIGLMQRPSGADATLDMGAIDDFGPLPGSTSSHAVAAPSVPASGSMDLLSELHGSRTKPSGPSAGRPGALAAQQADANMLEDLQDFLGGGDPSDDAVVAGTPGPVQDKAGDRSVLDDMQEFVSQTEIAALYDSSGPVGPVKPAGAGAPTLDKEQDPEVHAGAVGPVRVASPRRATAEEEEEERIRAGKMGKLKVRSPAKPKKKKKKGGRRGSALSKRALTKPAIAKRVLSPEEAKVIAPVLAPAAKEEPAPAPEFLTGDALGAGPARIGARRLQPLAKPSAAGAASSTNDPASPVEDDAPIDFIGLSQGLLGNNFAGSS